MLGIYVCAHNNMLFIIACCVHGIACQTQRISSLYSALSRIQLCKLHLKNLILPNVIVDNFSIYTRSLNDTSHMLHLFYRERTEIFYKVIANV